MRVAHALIALAGFSGAVVGVSAQTPTGAVTVALRPGVPISRGLVTVGDVADLSGGSPELRQHIAGIDLDTFSPRGPDSLRITREQVVFRLRLAGVTPGTFKLAGAAAVRVTRDGPIQQASYRPTPPSPAPERNEVLIKARDPVRMVVRLGGVQVQATGEALQAGRAGEWIRVRNTNSRAEVRARVVQSGLVEVEH